MATTFLLQFLFLFCLCDAHHWRTSDRREFIELPNGPAGVVWVVQLSDLHISTYRPSRAHSLMKLVGPLLALVNPALVLITGDLTDGKTIDLATMRQDELEWVQYKEAIDSIILQSGLPQYAFFDLRGNHDKFGVPEVGGDLDYFSKYSISALRNRTDDVHSVTLLNSGWKHLFVGVDESMDIGLRGPCNLFGHARDRHLGILDRELSQWDGSPLEMVSKIVYGHFPTSFIASTKNGKRMEDIFLKHCISGYLCGHLHCEFGRNLFKHHLSPSSEKCRGFWEWEMGDWKENQIMRIIAIDDGHTSFLDLNLVDLNVSSGGTLQNLDSFVLLTYPLDSQKMQRIMAASQTYSVQDSVRALVFSHETIISAKAKIYDSKVAPCTAIEELEMQSSSKSSDRGQYFVGVWNSSKFIDSSPTRYSLQIVMVDSSGKQTVSERRPFSVNGKIDRLKWTWAEFFVMGIVWDALYQPLLWAGFCILLILLIVPKLYCLYLAWKENKDLFFSVLSRYHAKRSTTNEIFVDILRLLACSCERHTLWWGQISLVLYLMFLPWFWGLVLADGYPAGYMSIWGWTVELPGVLVPQSGLGVPDVMVIVLPYVYQVLLPLFVLVLTLFAERSIVQLHVSGITKPTWKEYISLKSTALDGYLDKALLDNGTIPRGEKQVDLGNQEVLDTLNIQRRDKDLENHDSNCKLCKRWMRKALLLGCLGVGYLHAKQTWAIVRAYGYKALLISPGLAWPVPVLLIAASLQTSSLAYAT